MRLAKFLRITALTALGAALIAGIASYWLYRKFNHSLAPLTGNVPAAGLSAKVTIERDAQGVPTIHASSERDAVSALGWLHAQERFFQMDLMRRAAAGELAALLGPQVLAQDKANRIHSFRTVARASLEKLPEAQKQLLAAYTEGVNQGLAALGEKPPEYVILRDQPAPWLAEDSLLTIHAMWIQLQASSWRFERNLSEVRDRLGLAVANWISPAIGPDDQAFDGSTAVLPPLPSPKSLNLRKNSPAPAPSASREGAESLSPGSNNFALSGAHTASGTALIAGDMHLAHRVPNTWFRARLVFPESSAADARKIDITGLTLPGVQHVLAGSNGHLAWTFTNAHADTADLVAVAPSDISDEYYALGGKNYPYEKRSETILVRGEAPVTVEILVTPWGPVIGQNAQKRNLALKWLAHTPEAPDLTLGELTRATSLEAGIQIAHRAGIPALNILLAHREGHIAYTLAGHLPQRFGFDGRLPASWSYGDRGWQGFLPASEIPILSSDPALAGASGAKELHTRLATANQRLFGGPAINRIGDGGYAAPARAERINERLRTLEKASASDLLAIQLDTRAASLDRWQTLFSATLRQLGGHEPLLAAIEKAPSADLDSTSFRLVKRFKERVTHRALSPIFERCVEASTEFSYAHFNSSPALWQLLTERPLHLLSPDYADWDELLQKAARDVSAELDKAGLTPAEATWGRENISSIRHPLSRALPSFVSGWLDMPATALPGASDVPRVQTASFGASQRLVVSPGREAEGFFHMPCGQSGHPLSPFYRAGHEDWESGRASPFLPGPTCYTLTLTP